MPLTTDDELRELLRSVRTVALVGASDRPDRPSWSVMKAMQAHGWRVVPVNPKLAGERIHGEYVFGRLEEVGVPIDMVDIFRSADEVPPVVEAAIRVGAKAVWMQLGVVNALAAERAEAAGLDVVMDRCPKIELPRLGVEPVSDPA